MWSQTKIIFLVLSFSILGLKDTMFHRNAEALHLIRVVERVDDGCTIAGGGLTWHGEKNPTYTIPSFAATAFAAMAPDSLMPDQKEWKRQGRLYYWFLAQGLAQRGQYETSLQALKEAQVGAMLFSSMHKMLLEDDLACHFLNRILAEDIIGRAESEHSTSEYAIQRIVEGHEEEVENGYSWALRYNPHRIDWRLVLARALLVQGEQLKAREVLTVLLQGDEAERDSAQKLLSEFDQ